MKALAPKIMMILFTVATLWSCSSGQVAQTGEYDDLYFTSSDRKQIQYASTSQQSLQYQTQFNQSSPYDTLLVL